MAKKTNYWPAIKVPFWILVAWAVAGLIIANISFSTYMSVFGQWAALLLTVAVFAFLGYTAVKDHKLPKGDIFKAGALCGALSGLVGAVVGVIMINTVPQLTEYSVTMAVEKAGSAVDTAMVESWIKIGAYIQLIIGPVISAAIGGVISWITALIVKN